MTEIAIVEDEREHSARLKEYLDRYSAERDCALHTEIFERADDFLKKCGSFDIVFMDIELPDTDGMTAVKRLRENDKNVLVIFVTNLAQYAVKGYEVSAFDFIVKPVGYYDFAMKLRRAFECLNKRCKHELWVASRQGKKLVSADKLKYVEVMKHALLFHMANGETVTGTGTLKSVASKLDGTSFALCNQCYFVNLKYVTEVRGGSVFVGDDELQISIPKKKEFLRALNDWLATGGGTE